MGIWDRLGNVIKSHINYDSPHRASDPDIDAAYEELNDFLRGNGGTEKAKAKEQEKTTAWEKPIPESIKKAFAELGLTLEATADECKGAYKKLLKTHHPDRHSKNEENLKKATDKTARINAAYERLIKWFRE